MSSMRAMQRLPISRAALTMTGFVCRASNCSPKPWDGKTFQTETLPYREFYQSIWIPGLRFQRAPE